MNGPYTVYQHPTKGSWGFTKPVAGKNAHVVQLALDGTAKLSEVNAVALARVIQRLARDGFKPVTQPKYLKASVEGGVLRGQLQADHPDLDMGYEGWNLLFFVPVSGCDVPVMAESFASDLDGCPRGGPVRDRWLKFAGRVATYLPVIREAGPCEALVAAQWAFTHGLVPISMTEHRMPTAAPAVARYDWRGYLAKFWPDREVVEAFEALDWPLHEQLAVTPAAPTTEGISEPDWLTDAQQHTF